MARSLCGWGNCTGNFARVLADATKEGAVLHRTLNLPAAKAGSVRQVEENHMRCNYEQANTLRSGAIHCAISCALWGKSAR